MKIDAKIVLRIVKNALPKLIAVNAKKGMIHMETSALRNARMESIQVLMGASPVLLAAQNAIMKNIASNVKMDTL